MKRWLISLSFAACAASAFAIPTVGDVEAQVRKGDYTQAQSMMREVVEAKPGSAKAHYIYAEILAHNDRFVDAAEQVRMAKQLDPAIKFTDAAKFRNFEQLLDREQQRTQTRSVAPATETARQSPSVTAPAALPSEAPAQRGGGIPAWVWIGVAAVAFFAWRMMRTRAAPAMGPAGASYGPVAAQPGFGQAPGYGQAPGFGPAPGYGGGMMQQPGRGGSGLLGTGLAAAGGVAAGMMAEKWLSGSGNHHDASNAGSSAFDNAGVAGGNSFASPDRDQAARDLEQRDVDFGSGNDWSDGGSSPDAGSFDTGSSGSSDDW